MRRFWKYALAGLAVLVVLTIAGGLYLRSRLDPMARDWITRALEDRFKSEVEIGDLKLVLGPLPEARASNVKLRHHGRTDVPPILQISKLTVQGDYVSLMAEVKRVNFVKLEGLTITLPPKRPGEPRIPRLSANGGQKKPPPQFELARILADGTMLRILPKTEGKEPLEWDLQKLTLTRVGPGKPMNFVATILNPRPKGEVRSSGSFGPWNGEDPGQSPVEGDYTFRDADLSVFKGIAGILSSDGKYRGMLERIEAEGTTDTPDFRLGDKGNRVPLKTDFRAVIDGTDGDTLLQPVNARLGSTYIVCRGGVTGTPGVKGKTINLQTQITKGRIDDLLRLAVNTKQPMMRGPIQLKANLLIPPGDRDVIEKMRLNGRFNMDRIVFSSAEVQQKLGELSQKAQGKPKEQPEGNVASHFDGAFVLSNANLSLSDFTFAMPGADVQLAGSYGLRSEAIDMEGQLRMQARISQTQTGWKRIVLKPVDPFFAKDGAGAVVPIRIGGTKEKPEFGLRLRGKKKDEEQRARSER
jgi:hypothetical protein